MMVVLPAIYLLNEFLIFHFINLRHRSVEYSSGI